MIRTKTAMTKMEGTPRILKAEFAVTLESVAKSGLFESKEEAKEFLDQAFKVITDNKDESELSETDRILREIIDTFIDIMEDIDDDEDGEGVDEDSNKATGNSDEITVIYGDKTIKTDSANLGKVIDELARRGKK